MRLVQGITGLLLSLFTGGCLLNGSADFLLGIFILIPALAACLCLIGIFMMISAIWPGTG